MKICYVCNSSPWTKFHGGGQIFIHNLAQNLSSLGHHITVIYAGPNSGPIEVAEGKKYNIRWAPYVGYPWTPKFRQLNSITLLQKVKILDKKLNFDVINAIGGEALLLPRWCKENNKNFVFSIEHPDVKAIKPVLRFSKPFQGIISILRSRDLIIQKYVCKHANGVVTPSIFTKLEAIKHFGISSSKIRIIAHGILEEMLQEVPRPYLNKVNGPIVFFGRLEPQKGVDILIKAYRKLLKQNILSKQKLIIIGSGPNENLYRILVHKLGIKSAVCFKGWRDSTYIKKTLSNACLCVLPSRAESFGLSVAETLSQGVPLVTTLSGSIPEVVDYGRGGWVAKHDDINSLSATIGMAIENYNESQKKAQFGKKFVRSKFTWPKAAKKYEEFYLEIIKN